MACDVANSVSDAWFRLGFTDIADMSAANRWVTPAQLYHYADEAVRRMVYSLGAFKTYDASVNVTPGAQAVTLPTAWVFTVSAWLTPGATVPVQLLRLTSTGRLFALDATAAATQGNPTRLSLDAGSANTGVLYPVPIAPATLAQVQQTAPSTVASGASALPLSSVCVDYFTYALLAVALSKESDNSRPDVAAHCLQRMLLYEKIFESYWGPGQ